jgi:hypothetical protein
MTHDELLSNINKEIDEKAFIPERYYPTRYLIALRAVVELHKPQDITLPNGEWGSNCQRCDGWQYPCPTIQSIEKELK